jgi:Trm5-related predicted tRNA methylase
VGKHEQCHTEVFADEVDKLVYLSPDATDVLMEIDPDKIYIIGGIADTHIQKVRASTVMIAFLRPSLCSDSRLRAITASLRVSRCVRRETRGSPGRVYRSRSSRPRTAPC